MRGRLAIAFLVGLLLGLGGGLYLAWEAFPPPPGGASPADLAPPYQDLWVVLTAYANQLEGDPVTLRRRLDALAWPDLPERVSALVERGLLENWPSGLVRALARVAQQVGARSPALVVVLATPVPTRPLPSPTLIPTPSPVPTATSTPYPSPTSSPTREPSPTPSPAQMGTPTSTPRPSVPYVAEQRSLCEPLPLLRIRVFSLDGRERAGVRLWVNGPRGMETLLTGLKPGMGEGYADVRMEPQEAYQVGVESPEPVLSELVARPCASPEGGTGWTGWEIWVRLPR
ncbi:hypothetical protein [Thermoflexus sp.]|uniref:hypothetical protein n=1 Tax=Thermoflexus sp. TaxID=1969742 RepID=UPI0035E462E5